jgi:hypothetical protein
VEAAAGQQRGGGYGDQQGTGQTHDARPQGEVGGHGGGRDADQDAAVGRVDDGLLHARQGKEGLVGGPRHGPRLHGPSMGAPGRGSACIS